MWDWWIVSQEDGVEYWRLITSCVRIISFYSIGRISFSALLSEDLGREWWEGCQLRKWSLWKKKNWNHPISCQLRDDLVCRPSKQRNRMKAEQEIFSKKWKFREHSKTHLFAVSGDPSLQPRTWTLQGWLGQYQEDTMQRNATWLLSATRPGWGVNVAQWIHQNWPSSAFGSGK